MVEDIEILNSMLLRVWGVWENGGKNMENLDEGGALVWVVANQTQGLATQGNSHMREPAFRFGVLAIWKENERIIQGKLDVM